MKIILNIQKGEKVKFWGKFLLLGWCGLCWSASLRALFWLSPRRLYLTLLKESVIVLHPIFHTLSTILFVFSGILRFITTLPEQRRDSPSSLRLCLSQQWLYHRQPTRFTVMSGVVWDGSSSAWCCDFKMLEYLCAVSVIISFLLTHLLISGVYPIP